MGKPDEQMGELDFTGIDMGEVTLAIAESQIQEYERHRYRPNAWMYLAVADINLESAARQGKDTSQHHERLEGLYSRLPHFEIL